VKRNQVADWSCSADSLSAFSLHRASSGRSENHVFSDGDSHRPVRSVNHAIVAPLVCTARAMVSNAAAASQVQMGNWSRSSYQRKKNAGFGPRRGLVLKWNGCELPTVLGLFFFGSAATCNPPSAPGLGGVRGFAGRYGLNRGCVFSFWPF
jgi:hypothetical protein